MVLSTNHNKSEGSVTLTQEHHLLQETPEIRGTSKGALAPQGRSVFF
ncbi:MAG: hypothetical protein HC862_03310 [Scytonema sp. RU_4_4]|nr:hypothetical protein [Scytonema sp. RU_4_4]